MSADVTRWGPDAVAVVLVVALAGSAFFSGCETGLMSTSRARLARRAGLGDRRVAVFERLRASLDDAILTCLVGTNLSNVLVSAVTAAVLTSVLGARGEGLAVLSVSLVLVVFGEILPKILYREYPEQLSLASLPILRGFRMVITPVRWALGAYAALLSRLVATPAADGAGTLDRRGLASWLSSSAPAAGDRAFGRTMGRFLDLSQLRIVDLMRPLEQIVTVPTDVTLDEALAEAARSGFSRLPIRGTDVDLDGYLLVRDLLLAEGDTARHEAVPVRLVRPLLLVDAAMSPYELFEELHARGAQLATVVDHHGRALGIVTLEDLIEKVTGAIADEFDPPEELG